MKLFLFLINYHLQYLFTYYTPHFSFLQHVSEDHGKIDSKNNPQSEKKAAPLARVDSTLEMDLDGLDLMCDTSPPRIYNYFPDFSNFRKAF